MKAIFKRELKGYFTSMLGYVYIAIFLFLTGLMFYSTNIVYTTTTMTGFFQNINTFVVLILPVITMRLFSEDRKNKTDQLLLTSPISITSMVMGKFLAAFSVFLIGCAITLVYPFIMSFFGKIAYAETISCYLGFILMCAVIISIGAFMSSLTESQIVAAVATYGVLILTLFIGGFAGNVSNEWLVKLMLWLSPIKRFSDFTLGVLDIEAIVYYITLCALFLFLTVHTFEKRRWN